MNGFKPLPAAHLITTIVVALCITHSAFAQKAYKVGVPVCDTIGARIFSYDYFGGCGSYDYLWFRLIHPTLIPYVTGLNFQVVITETNGRIWSSLSDTVKVGDIFPLGPAPIDSGVKIFMALNSSFKFITRIIGTPTVPYENYYCEIKQGQTAAMCGNYWDYLGEGPICQVQHATAGDIIRVPQDYLTIQSAIEAASNGDTVLVSPGTYRENIDFLGKDIVVSSLFLTTRNKQYINDTVIDPDSGSVVTFANRETEKALLYGFTITGGTGTIIDSTKKEFVFGAGLLIRGASPVIRNNLITRNATWPACFGRGGGIAIMDSANPRIARNVITKNDVFGRCTHMSYYGGGIWVDSASNPIIAGSREEANDIYANQAGYGTEIYREGAGNVINAQFNYWGSCPPGSFEVWPKHQFDVAICLSSPVTKVEVDNNYSPVTAFQLYHNYPNPFNPETTIEFYLSRPDEVSLKVFNLRGEEIATLINQKKLLAGNHKIKWNAENLPSGIYFYRLQTGRNFFATKKLVLLK
jgi:hypothetical protein